MQQSPTLIATSSSSIPPPATTNTAIEPPTDAPASCAGAITLVGRIPRVRGRWKSRRTSLKKVGTFFGRGPNLGLAHDDGDQEARRIFKSEEAEGVKSKQPIGLGRNSSEEYQGVWSNPKEVVGPQPEAAPMDVDVDVVSKVTLPLPEPPSLLPPPVRARSIPSMPRSI